MSHSSKEGRFYKPIDRGYMWMLRWSMAHRWAIVLICAVVIGFDLCRSTTVVGYNFLPDEDESAFQVCLRAPQGTSLPATQSVLERIARDVREQIPGVESTLVNAGGFGGGAPNAGSVSVRLRPVEERKFSQADLIQQTRDLIRKRKYPKEYVITALGRLLHRRGIGGGGRGGVVSGLLHQRP